MRQNDAAPMGNSNLHVFTTGLKEAILLDITKFNAVKALFHKAQLFYQNPLSGIQLGWYAEHMMDYAFEEIEEAFHMWYKMPRPKGHNPRAPLPQDLIALINPSTDALGEANVLANKLFGALKCGWNHPDIAREKVGELVWAAVNERGGWPSVCMAKTEDQHAFVAQWRDYLRAMIDAQGTENLKALREQAQLAISERREEKATAALHGVGEVIKKINVTQAP